jgi:hypothetical protein
MSDHGLQPSRVTNQSDRLPAEEKQNIYDDINKQIRCSFLLSAWLVFHVYMPILFFFFFHSPTPVGVN